MGREHWESFLEMTTQEVEADETPALQSENQHLVAHLQARVYLHESRLFLTP